MRSKLAFFLALLGWTAIIIQFLLMMQNRTTSKLEATIRFFSFFTILTNLLVALFFSLQVYKMLQVSKAKQSDTKGLTPVTIYITIVGSVYQILLRHTWSPTGLQMIVDELLHSVIPVSTIIYWYLYGPKSNYGQIPKWMLFPLIYLVYILIRGSFSNFYPYPFINVPDLGMQRVIINSFFLLIGFILISIAFVWLGKLKTKTTNVNAR